MATDEKYGRLKQLMEVGKEKGFVLYDEVNELLAEDFPSSGREFEDLLSDLDSAGVEILEEPKLDFEKKEEPDDLADLELAQDAGDVPWLTVHGRRGGSAIAASAINALASEHE